MTAQTLPTGSAERKAVPLARGVLDYFPAALAAVAKLSQAGNDKHNPGEELHHARGKSTDHADCILRHLVDRGIVDPEDGIRHSVKVAWRALALLQEELEREEGAPLPRGARAPGPVLDPVQVGNGIGGRPNYSHECWYPNYGSPPLLAGATLVRVELEDGTQHTVTVDGVSWAPWWGKATVSRWRLATLK